MDFSLFKPRGHYATKEELQKYFKAMSWCGTVDLRVAGDKKHVSTRELGSSVVLYALITKDPEVYKAWENFDNVLQQFVGITDSMTFSQLGQVLRAANIKNWSDIKKEEDLVALQNKILEMDVGMLVVCALLEALTLCREAKYMW